MASTARKAPSSSAAQAEIALIPNLKSCLLNLPHSLVALLLNTNAIAQNVVVELSYRQPSLPNSESKPKQSSTTKSVYLGWTGMQAQPKLAPMIGRDGIAGGRGGGGRQEQDVSVVEVDATFGRLLGLSDGMKVCLRISSHIHYIRRGLL